MVAAQDAEDLGHALVTEGQDHPKVVEALVVELFNSLSLYINAFYNVT